MRAFAAVSAFLVLAVGCGGFYTPSPGSLLGRQPRVVSVEPVDGETAQPDAVVVVEFSQPVDITSVNRGTLAVIKIDGGSKPLDEIAWDVVDGEKKGVDGFYDFEGEGLVAIFRSARPYEVGARYAIVASCGIVDDQMLPLNQRPGRSPTPFASTFKVVGAGEGEEGIISDDTTGDPNVSGNAGIKRPSTLVINEVLYDVPGSDTDGDVFIELAGDGGGNIDGYKINFINGDDGVIKDTITFEGPSIIPDDGIFLIADAKTGQDDVSDVPGADLIASFDPQNGPDCVQLLDDLGALVDAMGYGTPIVARAENSLACYEGTPATTVPPGQSLSRTDGLDTNNNSNDFHKQPTPTPGVP